ncbi:diaminopimelate decarboxylase [Halomicrococcus sp. SG-WS-1]|uniref:diaminopimelate decarboxylase n=1 Tax=Halomicrococcus sp. SG-WS-1 TaxID=3439057 RepID=UPI003F7A29E0
MNATGDAAGASARSTDAENPPVRRLADWDDAALAGLADEHGTPLYVLDLDRVRRNYRRFAAAFPDAAVHYAAKANTARPVLRTLEAEGAGVECASAGELERALDAGFPGERVHYTAVNPPAGDLDRAVELAAEHPELTITAGAEDTLDRLAERGYDGRLCLRVNPGVGAGHHEKVRTGADAKFGVPVERAADLLADAAETFDVVGVHAHAGSGISGDDLSAHRELVARMGDLARDAPVDLEFVDVGGGFGVPYAPDDPPLDLAAVADATREALGAVDADLVVEPGRYLVADAGVLLARVNTVKETPETTVVGVDAGMTTLARPALYDARHEVRTLGGGSADGRVEATVTGPICESADTFGEHALADPERGDVLAVGNAGAYGYEMASQYNSRPRPATVVVDGDRSAVARERETTADVVAGEREVNWL